MVLAASEGEASWAIPNEREQGTQSNERHSKVLLDYVFAASTSIFLTIYQYILTNKKRNSLRTAGDAWSKSSWHTEQEFVLLCAVFWGLHGNASICREKWRGISNPINAFMKVSSSLLLLFLLGVG